MGKMVVFSTGKENINAAVRIKLENQICRFDNKCSL